MKPVLTLLIIITCCSRVVVAQADIQKITTGTPVSKEGLIRLSDSLHGVLLSDKISTGQAARYFNYIIAQSKAHDFRLGLISGLDGLGLVNIFDKQYEVALSHFKEALALCDSTDTTRYMYPRLYNNIAYIFRGYGDYEKAMDYFNRSLQVKLWLPNRPNLELAYNNIGTVLMAMGRYEKTLYYFHKAEAIVIKEMNLKDGFEKKQPYKAKQESLSYIQLNLGIAYGNIGDSAQSEKYLDAALQTTKDIPHIRQNLLVTRATFYLKNKNPQKALDLLKKARQILKEGNLAHRADEKLILNLGRAYFQLKLYDKAEQYAMQVLREAELTNDMIHVMDAHLLLAETYAVQNKHALAYHHKVKEKYYQDSILTKEQADAVNMMETRYRTAEKDKEIAENKLLIKSKEQELIKKNIFIALTILGALFLTTFFLILYRNYKHKQNLQNNKIQLLEQQQQILEMKSIMNGEEKERTRIARELHDSIMIQFSVAKMNLSSFIGSHANGKEQELKEILKQLDNATINLRNTAHNLMPDMLLQEGLVAALDYFCDNCSDISGIDIEFQHFGNIPRMHTDFELSLYRIVQELVQNILKHAKARKIIIEVSCINDVLSITVEDDGIGIQQVNYKDKRGLGLKSIEARVQSVYGYMELESNEGEGVTVHLEFEVRNVM